MVVGSKCTAGISSLPMNVSVQHVAGAPLKTKLDNEHFKGPPYRHTALEIAILSLAVMKYVHSLAGYRSG